ncbi:hypothetical protein BDR04DRAFT_563532 [Suillus decipiens]|nr:hypothetical protein BDR04DRAFT_563532 [Suillus decipiens]
MYNRLFLMNLFSDCLDNPLRLLCTMQRYLVYDMSGKTILGPIEIGYKAWAVVYSPDMTMFATAGFNEPSTDPTIKMWDAKTGKLVAALKGLTGRVGCLNVITNRCII